MYKRAEYQTIKNRLVEGRKFIQVVMGPRQVGKSTVVRQVLQDIDIPYQFYSADNVPATNTAWVSNCWEATRSLMSVKGYDSIILVIDEIQKIHNWSEVIKKEWDDDTFHARNIKVLLLGSSRVLLERGLSESLGGRFEEIRMTHWSFPEMRDCFGFSLNEYIFYGGYPGAAELIHDADRWEQYIQSAIIDATINKDILMDAAVNKPALLRQTFELGAAYSGELLSLTKMLGTLQDAGNTVTLAGYINLLNESGLLCGLQKYSIDTARRRGRRRRPWRGRCVLPSHTWPAPAAGRRFHEGHDVHDAPDVRVYRLHYARCPGCLLDRAERVLPHPGSHYDQILQ